MSALDRAQQWASTHRGAAAGGAAGVGVIALALYRRRHAAGGAGAAAASATGSDPNTAGNPSGAINGLSGSATDPNTEIQNWVADQLAAQNSAMQAALSKRAPTPVTPAKPAPRPGSFRYKIEKGDTLAKIADRLFGEHDAHTLAALKHANPILATFGNTSALSYYSGETIAVPGVKPLNPKPKPKPVKRSTRPQQPPHAHGRPTPPKPKPVKRRH